MWTAAVKKGLDEKTQTTGGEQEVSPQISGGGGGGSSGSGSGGGGGSSGSGGGGGGGGAQMMWKRGKEDGKTNYTEEDGFVTEKVDVTYRHCTNPAGVQQCRREDGRVALLTGRDSVFTSSFRCPHRRDETDEEYAEMKRTAEEKRIRMLFSPELVDIVLHPTLTNEQKLGKLYDFVEQNYPEDFYTDFDGDRVLKYGINQVYRDAEPGESAWRMSKFDMQFDLRVYWLKPGVRFKLMVEHGYEREYLVTDEDFDTA